MFKLECINFLKTPDKVIPLFNGSSENNLENFDKYLANYKSYVKVKKNANRKPYFLKIFDQINFSTREN